MIKDDQRRLGNPHSMGTYRIFYGNIMENPGVNPEAVPMGEGYKVRGRFEDCCVVVVAHSLCM